MVALAFSISVALKKMLRMENAACVVVEGFGQAEGLICRILYATFFDRFLAGCHVEGAVSS